MRVACSAFPFVALAFLGGCSDPVPPTPQGAFQVNFSDPGVSCDIKSHRTEIGLIDGSKKTSVVVDGVDSADVNCSVTGTGPFAVDARVTVGGDTLYVLVPSISPGATEMSPAVGSASFGSTVTGGGAFSSPADTCSFYFKEGTAQGVAPGKIWVSFSCPEMIGDGTCALAESHAIFENCNQ